MTFKQGARVVVTSSLFNEGAPAEAEFVSYVRWMSEREPSMAKIKLPQSRPLYGDELTVPIGCLAAPVRGDGRAVTISLADETGRVSTFVVPKLVARKLADQIREASQHPEPGRKEPSDPIAALHAAVCAANDALFDAMDEDPEHTVECHADTLPERYARMACAIKVAMDALQPIVLSQGEKKSHSARGAP
jgi:hypothetical protein